MSTASILRWSSGGTTPFDTSSKSGKIQWLNFGWQGGAQTPPMSEVERQLRILEVLEQDPETTQAGLAAQLGVAVGSVNWYLKRLIHKGYVKATRMERRRLKYFVTPQGLALKAGLAREYLEVSLCVYRELRQAARETLAQVRNAGYRAVLADGQSEAMEILQLTCLEEGVRIETDTGGSALLPRVSVNGVRFVVEWPDRDGSGPQQWSTGGCQQG